jgi:hypothetical protein
MSDLDTALARLDDYLRRHASVEPADDYEQDLFERALAGAAPELGLREHLETALRAMNARGTLDLWLTAREVEQLSARGLRVLHYVLDPPNPAPLDLSADFDILVTKILIDLTGIRRVDAEVLTPDGVRLKLMPDIGFDPKDGAVFACCEAELARVSSAAKTVTRVWAHDDAGRRLIGEIRSSE